MIDAIKNLIKRQARRVLREELDDMQCRLYKGERQFALANDRRHAAEMSASAARAHLSTQFSPLAECARALLRDPRQVHLHESARVMLAMVFYVADLDSRGPGITSPFSRCGLDPRLDPAFKERPRTHRSC